MLLHFPAHGLGAEAILLCQVLDSLIDCKVVDFDAGFLGRLNLGFFNNQTLENFTCQLVFGGDLLHTLGLHGLQNALDARPHLIVGDGFGIDDRHNVVGRAQTLCGG